MTAPWCSSRENTPSPHWTPQLSLLNPLWFCSWKRWATHTLASPAVAEVWRAALGPGWTEKNILCSQPHPPSLSWELTHDEPDTPAVSGTGDTLGKLSEKSSRIAQSCLFHWEPTALFSSFIWTTTRIISWGCPTCQVMAIVWWASLASPPYSQYPKRSNGENRRSYGRPEVAPDSVWGSEKPSWRWGCLGSFVYFWSF